MNDISKDKDYQEFFAGIKELAKGLMQIRERAAIEYAPIVEEFCARKHATANEVGRMLDYLFEFADDERILLMYKKVCRRFVYDYPETISYYILTSSLRTPKIFIKEFGDFLMSCHQHCLGVNLLVQR